jgi:hypothetical protein
VFRGTGTARRRWRALRGGAIATALVAALACATPAGTAYAATPGSHPYSKAWTFASAPLGICVRFEVIGTITYNFASTRTRYGVTYSWSDIQVSQPELEAFVYYYDGRACWSNISESATKMAMMQSWSGYSCTFNPALTISSAAAGLWSTAFKFWPSCGNRTQASYSTAYPTRSTTYLQFNSGNVFSYQNSIAVDNSAGPCYGVRVTGTVYVGGNDDTFTSGSDSVCI